MRKRGFTLLEILIVIGILIILIRAAVVPMFRASLYDARVARVKADLVTIKTASYMLNLDTGEWPPEGNEGDGLMNSNGITETSKWRGPYLGEWKDDPWGNPYEIYIDTNTSILEVISFGTGGVWGGSGTDADITLLITPNPT